jgi:hypothetical protein
MPTPIPHGTTPLPPDVGHKLRACGESLTARQWAALPLLARQRLRDAPAGTPMERAAFRLLLHWLRETFPPGRAA